MNEQPGETSESQDLRRIVQGPRAGLCHINESLCGYSFRGQQLSIVHALVHSEFPGVRTILSRIAFHHPDGRFLAVMNVGRISVNFFQFLWERAGGSREPQFDPVQLDRLLPILHEPPVVPSPNICIVPVPHSYPLSFISIKTLSSPVFGQQVESNWN